MNCFDRGIALSNSVIDYYDTMLADIRKWEFANIEMHAGYWHNEVKRAHYNRMEGKDGAEEKLRKAQAAYIRICNLGYLEGY